MKPKKRSGVRYDFYVENSTNQQLPVLPDAVLKNYLKNTVFHSGRKWMKIIAQ